MGFTDKQTALLDAKLNPAHVKQREKSGMKLAYIEGWHAIAEANRIFGFDGWSSEVIELYCVRQPELVNGKNRVGYMARVRITAGDAVRDGIGYGSGIAQDVGDAHESAIKEAETDARKRALMTFGNPFGLALYDKSRENVGFDDPALSIQPERRSSNSLKKDGSWAKAMDALRVAIDLGEDAVFAANRSLEAVVQTWPPTWQEQYKEALERALERTRGMAA